MRVFEKALYEAIEKAANRLSAVASKYRHLPKKNFVSEINSMSAELSPLGVKVVLKLYDAEKEAIDFVLEVVKESCKSPQLLERARELLGSHIKFTEAATPPANLDD